MVVCVVLRGEHLDCEVLGRRWPVRQFKGLLDCCRPTPVERKK